MLFLNIILYTKYLLEYHLPNKNQLHTSKINLV
jgi:hypothetical protein